MSETEKKQQIKDFVIELLAESRTEELNKIDKALSCGALDLEEWDGINSRFYLPKIIAASILKDASTCFDGKGTSYERKIKKEINNLMYFI